MNKQLQKVFQKMHAVITNGWCKGVEARDIKGNPVEPDSKSAVKWCLAGALRKVTRSSDLLCKAKGTLQAVINLNTNDKYCSIPRFNDRSPNKKRVLNVIEKAAQK